jgi:Envelope integrity protein A
MQQMRMSGDVSIPGPLGAHGYDFVRVDRAHLQLLRQWLEAPQFFGTVSRGLATLIEKAVSQWGLPNGYVLGEEGGAAFFGGLRYGEGTLYTKNAGDLKVYWQGPLDGISAETVRGP